MQKVRVPVATISRAAAKAVRVSLENGNKITALQIASSIIYSNHHYAPGRSTSSPEFPRRIAVDFGQAISPRLACHTLLHGLIREGDIEEAGKVAHRMLNLNMRVRSKSLEVAVGSFCNVRSKPIGGALSNVVGPLRGYMQHTDFTMFSPKKIQSPELSLAVEIFFAAKEYQKQRTKSMFQSLINACMLQGEIMVFTFLLAFMFNQWQSKHQAGREETREGIVHAKDGVEASRKMERPILHEFKWRELGYNHWFPDESEIPNDDEYLRSLLQLIKHTLRDEASSIDSQRQALQALAILANMLDTGWLPTKEVGRLVRLLRTFPMPEVVLVFDGKRWLARNAQVYFNDVIQRYIQTVSEPDEERSRYVRPSRGTMNSLLIYALKARSSELVEKLSQRIVSRQGQKMTPDITAYNILMHGGTLLRQADVVEEVLDRLKTRPENVERGVPFLKEGNNLPTTTSQPDSEVAAMVPSNEDDLVGAQTIEISEQNDEPLIDRYTLAAYISYLTAAGRPHIVVDMLFHLIPELCIVDHPAAAAPRDPNNPLLSQSELDIEAIARTYYNNREDRKHKALIRAVQHGPYFFTVILNAVRKTGKTGLAERVWALAKKAELASWDPRLFEDGIAKPWCLPIHAYTCMMQCYAGQMKTGLSIYKLRSELLSENDTGWMPRRDNLVRGWAGLAALVRKQGGQRRDLAVSRCTAYQMRQRDVAAQEMAKILYQSMLSGASQVFDALAHVRRSAAENVKPELHNLQVPRPDIRFFNAALDLFGRRRSTHTRNARPNWSRCKRHLRRAQMRYVKTGEAPIAHSQTLLDILLAIRSVGYEVPIGYRSLLIGKEPLLLEGTTNPEPARGKGRPLRSLWKIHDPADRRSRHARRQQSRT